jgi:hypothetical protein
MIFNHQLILMLSFVWLLSCEQRGRRPKPLHHLGSPPYSPKRIKVQNERHHTVHVWQYIIKNAAHTSWLHWKSPLNTTQYNNLNNNKVIFDKLAGVTLMKSAYMIKCNKCRIFIINSTDFTPISIFINVWINAYLSITQIDLHGAAVQLSDHNKMNLKRLLRNKSQERNKTEKEHSFQKYKITPSKLNIAIHVTFKCNICLTRPVIL